MDTLTAIRTFAKPGSSPAKRTRIMNNKWYLVRFQNVETDPRCDYVGLAEGEYVQLLPGNKARQGRDAHLNHCNGITEWTGGVYELFISRYGGELQHRGWYADAHSAQIAAETAQAEHNKWIADCQKAQNNYLTKAAAVRTGESKCIMTADHLEQAARDCAKVIAENLESFQSEIRLIK